MSQNSRINRPKTAVKVIELVVDARKLIEATIEAHGAIREWNKNMLVDDVKVVSDNLPVVLGLLHDIQTQWSEDKLSYAVWFAAADDVFMCHGACRGLHKVLREAYTRLDLDEGAPVTKHLGKLLARKGTKAKMLLEIVHESMKLLEPLKIVTDVRLLPIIEDALVHLRSGSNAIELITQSISLITNSILIYDAIRKEFSVPQKLETVSDGLTPLLDILDSFRSRWQERILDSRALVDAQADLTKCHAECEGLANYLRCAYPRLRVAADVDQYADNDNGNDDDDDDDDDSDERMLRRDIDVAGQYFVDVYRSLKPLLHRQVFTDETLLAKIQVLAEALPQMWELADDDLAEWGIGHDGNF